MIMVTIVERRKLIWFTEHKIQGRAIEYSSCSFNQNKSDNTNELKEKKESKELNENIFIHITFFH